MRKKQSRGEMSNNNRREQQCKRDRVKQTGAKEDSKRGQDVTGCREDENPVLEHVYN